MNTLARDPKGYYAILGLSPGADLDAIKKAYRARVKTVHPDRNASSRAREEFQRLLEAYAVLRDVVRRAEYDTTGHQGVDDDDDPPAGAIPIACSCCGSLTAQPRYVVHHTVRSFLVWAKTGRLEGIFCRVCADRSAVRASIITWLWGWWSLPGLLLAPLALLRNLLGGSKPRHENVRILLRQGRAFLARGEFEIARSLALQAARFARHSDDRARVEDLLDATRSAGGDRRLKSRWTLGGGVFLAQFLPLAALPITAAVFALIAIKPWDRPVSTATASIAMHPASIGEIRHVAVDGLKVRMTPAGGSPVLTLLDRFTTVEVAGTAESAEWLRIRTPSGVDGFVEARSLYAGSGARFKSQWCAENRGAPLGAGEVLTRRVGGDHRLLVHNEGRRDGVVKLKTLAGHTVTAFHVPATYHIGIGGIPDGTYRIEFATGSRYSRGCGVFLDDMQAAVLPVTLTFKYLSPGSPRSLTSIAEISLAPAPDDPVQPQPLAPERFIADE